MEDKSKSEEMIDELIKKRRLENDAFQKLLDAMRSRNNKPAEKQDEAAVKKNTP